MRQTPPSSPPQSESVAGDYLNVGKFKQKHNVTNEGANGTEESGGLAEFEAGV